MIKCNCYRIVENVYWQLNVCINSLTAIRVPSLLVWYDKIRVQMLTIDYLKTRRGLKLFVSIKVIEIYFLLITVLRSHQQIGKWSLWLLQTNTKIKWVFIERQPLYRKKLNKWNINYFSKIKSKSSVYQKFVFKTLKVFKYVLSIVWNQNSYVRFCVI